LELRPLRANAKLALLTGEIAAGALLTEQILQARRPSATRRVLPIAVELFVAGGRCTSRQVSGRLRRQALRLSGRCSGR
jgi:hypothetical protein